MVARSMWRGSVAGVALGGLVIVGGSAWAAPPLDSELFAYTQAECVDEAHVSPDEVLFTRASFATSPDGDNDVNAGDEVIVSLGLTMPAGTTRIFDSVVGMSFAGESATVNPDSFAVPVGSEVFMVPGAEAAFTVPAAVAGTVVQARIDSWDFAFDANQAQCETAAGEGIVGLYVNKPPALGDDTATTDPDESITIDVLANDDATWDSGVIESNNPTVDEIAGQDDLSEVPAALRSGAVVVVSGPAHGTAVFDSDSNVLFTPDEGFEGSDSFEYALTDNDGARTTATVTVRVGNPSTTAPATPTPPKRVDAGL